MASKRAVRELQSKRVRKAREAEAESAAPFIFETDDASEMDDAYDAAPVAAVPVKPSIIAQDNLWPEQECLAEKVWPDAVAAAGEQDATLTLLQIEVNSNPLLAERRGIVTQLIAHGQHEPSGMRRDPADVCLDGPVLTKPFKGATVEREEDGRESGKDRHLALKRAEIIALKDDGFIIKL
jgi:hypothetical protein